MPGCLNINSNIKSPGNCWSNICHWGSQTIHTWWATPMCPVLSLCYLVLLQQSSEAVINITPILQRGSRLSNKQVVLCCSSYQPVQPFLVSNFPFTFFSLLFPPFTYLPLLLSLFFFSFSFPSFSFQCHFIFTLKTLDQALCFRFYFGLHIGCGCD